MSPLWHDMVLTIKVLCLFWDCSWWLFSNISIWSETYNTILYCTILYYTILYYTILYYNLCHWAGARGRRRRRRRARSPAGQRALIYVYTYAYIYIYIERERCICIDTHTHTYTYTCTHTYTCTVIYTHTARSPMEWEPPTQPPEIEQTGASNEFKLIFHLSELVIWGSSWSIGSDFIGHMFDSLLS